MTTDLSSVLSTASKNYFIVAAKDHSSDVNFVFSSILSDCIKSNAPVIFVNLAQSRNHYTHLLIKSGVNIQILKDQNRITFIDVLSQGDHLNNSESDSSDCDIIKSVVSGVDSSLNYLYLTIQNTLENLSTNASKGFALVIDEINVLMNLGVSLEEVQRFVLNCHILCKKEKLHGKLVIGTGVDEVDNEAVKLVNYISHLADVKVQVQSLKTGHCKDADGKGLEEFISSTLPGIGYEKVTQLALHLAELGVLSLGDLKYVEEEHIKEILLPIQCKKFIDLCRNFKIIQCAEMSSSSSDNSESQPLNIEIVPPGSKTILNHHEKIPFPLTWADDFEVPFEVFPEEIQQAFEKHHRPSKRSVNDMVRIVATNICKIDDTPGRKNLRIIAAKIIDRFPGVFEDRICEQVVGDGLLTLVKKIENVLDNKKRTRSSVEEYFEDVTKRRKTSKESYGCVHWQPLYSLDESNEELLGYQNLLIEEFTKCSRNNNMITELMNKTYAIQRYFINNVQTSIADVKLKWPFLLESKYLLNHATILLGKDMQERFSEEIPDKGKKVYDFMKTLTKKKNVLKCIKEIEMAKVVHQNLQAEYIGSIPLLIAYFGEEESLLFKQKSHPDDIRTESLLTPYLVTSGRDIYSSEEFSLVIDGQITTHCNDFITAMATLFVTYYVFNIEYNSDTAITLEFIQRCIADINPKRGTKAGGKYKNKHGKITQKVINLANEINEYDKVFKIKTETE